MTRTGSSTRSHFCRNLTSLRGAGLVRSCGKSSRVLLDLSLSESGPQPSSWIGSAVHLRFVCNDQLTDSSAVSLRAVFRSGFGGTAAQGICPAQLSAHDRLQTLACIQPRWLFHHRLRTLRGTVNLATRHQRLQTSGHCHGLRKSLAIRNRHVPWSNRNTDASITCGRFGRTAIVTRFVHS